MEAPHADWNIVAQDLGQRVRQLEIRTAQLDARVKAQRTQLNAAFLLLVLVGCCVIIHNQYPEGKVKADVEKWFQTLEKPTELPPFYLMEVESTTGTLLSLLAFGPPRLTPAPAPLWRRIATNAFRLCLLGNLLRALFKTTVAVSNLGADQYDALGNSQKFWWEFVIGACVLFGRNTTLVCGSASIFALFQLYIPLIKFVRAHDREARAQNRVYPGDWYTLRQIVNTNGPIFAVYAGICFVLIWPMSYISAVVVLGPVMVLYFWWYVPLIGSGILFVRCLTALVCRFFHGQAVDHYNIMIEQHAQPWMFDVQMQPLNAPQDRDVIEFIERDIDRSAPYQENLNMFLTSRMNKLAWIKYLSCSVLVPPLTSMLVINAGRIFTGQGYGESLWLTISERHWWTYLDSCKKVAGFVLGLIGIH